MYIFLLFNQINFNNELTENNSPYFKKETINSDDDFGILTLVTVIIPSSRFRSFVVQYRD